ncbi:MAG: flagellar basal body L-ring protein FlgH [Sedimenticolaceae bacterium]|jgi:flagellar L-ring protein precursor FlgH
MNSQVHNNAVRYSAGLKLLILLAIAAVLLTGCNTAPVADPAFAAVPPAAIPQAPQGNGSIYQAGFERSWFENVRARRVGDILLVRLVEDTEAVHSNKGKLKKRSDTDIANPTLFGMPVGGVYNLSQMLSSESDFKGEADNTQNNELTGSLTVMVTELLGNGYMRVRGEKRIGMTGGNEYIRVSGIVRPEDIDVDNTVDSTRVGDASLIYVGDGQTSMATTMGWLAKFFISALMPF